MKIELPSNDAVNAVITDMLGTLPPLMLTRIQAAFEDDRVHIKAVPGAFLMKSFTGVEWYRLPHTGGCECRARGAECKHRWTLTVIEQAWAHPTTSRPTMPNLMDRVERLIRAKHATEAINELF